MIKRSESERKVAGGGGRFFGKCASAAQSSNVEGFPVISSHSLRLVSRDDDAVKRV